MTHPNRNPSNKRIGVLMGGISSEREISLKSGSAVYDALKSRNCDVVPLDLKTEKEKDIALAIRGANISFAFIAMHGRFGEDGTLQGILDRIGIPYTGSGKKASSMAMDKIASRKIFKLHGIPVPKSVIISKQYDVNAIIKKLKDFPLVVKPATQGSSIGVSIVRDIEGLGQGIRLALKFDNKVLVEEYISGRELTVGILDDRPLPVIEIVPKEFFFNYEAKYQAGTTEYVVPAQLPQDIARKVQKMGLGAHKAIKCQDFSRVDLILDKKNRPVVLEVNSIPGMTSKSLLPKAALASNITFDDLCLKLIKLGLCRRKNRK